MRKLSILISALLVSISVFAESYVNGTKVSDTSGGIINESDVAGDTVTDALNTLDEEVTGIDTNVYKKSEQILLYQNLDANGNWITNLAGVIMAGDINLASNEITEVKSMTLADAGVKIIDGKVNGTNYFGMVDSSNNTFRILLTIPQP